MPPPQKHTAKLAPSASAPELMSERELAFEVSLGLSQMRKQMDAMKDELVTQIAVADARADARIDRVLGYLRKEHFISEGRHVEITTAPLVDGPPLSRVAPYLPPSNNPVRSTAARPSRRSTDFGVAGRRAANVVAEDSETKTRDGDTRATSIKRRGSSGF